MRSRSQQFVPIAFWIGFLALGLASSTGVHDRAAAHKTRTSRAESVELLDRSVAAKRNVETASQNDWTPGDGAKATLD